METLSSFTQYETKVLRLLKEKIDSESPGGKKLQANYRYHHYTFDLVELDQNDKILKVYEVKTLQALATNFYFLVHLLETYKDVTNAQVYVVFLDSEEKLRVISADDINKSLTSRASKRSKIIRNYTIKNFSEFSETLHKVFNSENSEQGNYSELHYFYRGHSNIIYESVPSIFRNNNIIHEQQMFREAIRKEPSIFTEDMSTFDKLVKMQHYELPTRLLDITTNPLVALYFACQSNLDEAGNENDGAVLVFPMLNEQIKYYDDILVCILSNLAKCSDSFTFSKNKKDLEFYIQQDMHNYHGTNLRSRDLNNVYCVLPKLNNQRIIRQHGAFFIFGKGTTKKDYAKLQDKPIIIRVKADSKKSILKELQVFGIEEATLFPETEKIMKQIKLSFN